MPVDDAVLAFVRAHLPPPPARVLEVGAGRGELAAALRGAGYEVVAIDPAADGAPGVEAVPLHDFRADDGSFDAAVAIVSLHHVEPLAGSLARLAALVRPGGVLVVDEFDVSTFDERAARWQMGQRAAAGLEHPQDIAAWSHDLRGHLHDVATIRAALEPGFALGEPVRGPYLYRWELDPALRTVEEHLVAAGDLPATGARFVGIRR
jgi:2-polyprenyl-3-methyl-5-hydroxy-6-metoxy-1,4-benzoquinol methylase